MSELGVYYVIRHKASGELMPQMKRDRGYTHWNPSTPKELTDALDTPRLFSQLRKAKRVVKLWFVWPNMEYRYVADDYTLDVRLDGRTKDDLEVVEVEIVLRARHE